VISEEDLIWEDLRIWVDANQDGRSQESETGRLQTWRIVALRLDCVETDRIDGTGSWHRFEGRFIRRVKKLGMELLQTQAPEDIFFAFRRPH